MFRLIFKLIKEVYQKKNVKKTKKNKTAVNIKFNFSVKIYLIFKIQIYLEIPY